MKQDGDKKNYLYNTRIHKFNNIARGQTVHKRVIAIQTLKTNSLRNCLKTHRQLTIGFAVNCVGFTQYQENIKKDDKLRT